MRVNRTVPSLVLLAAFAGALPGCGRGSKTEVTTSSTTKGRELQDLEDAKNKGLISEKEYNAQRKKILERD